MKLRILLVLPLVSGTLPAQQVDPGPKATPPAGNVVPAQQKAVVPSFPGQEKKKVTSTTGADGSVVLSNDR